MPLPTQPVLKTARLVLRPLSLSDAADVFDYARDPEVLRFTTGRTPTQLDETEAFLREALSASSTNHWGICLAGTQRVVGIVEFSVDAPRRGSIHYALAAPFWRKGLMTEAVGAVCAWAFEALSDLNTIETAVVVENIGSARVLEKVGFRRVRRTEERWEKESSPVQLDSYVLDRGGCSIPLGQESDLNGPCA